MMRTRRYTDPLFNSVISYMLCPRINNHTKFALRTEHATNQWKRLYLHIKVQFLYGTTKDLTDGIFLMKYDITISKYPLIVANVRFFDSTFSSFSGSIIDFRDIFPLQNVSVEHLLTFRSFCNKYRIKNTTCT